jgi:hypothetical protein
MELMRMKLRMLSMGYSFMQMLRIQLKLGILRKMKMIIFKLTMLRMLPNIALRQ